MMNKMMTLTLIASISVLTGCASGSIRINATNKMAANSKIERPLIFLNMTNSVFKGSLYRGFQQGMTEYLSYCQAQATIIEFDSIDLEPIKSKLRRIAKEQNNDYTMLIKQDGGKIERGNGGTNANLYYKILIHPSDQPDSVSSGNYWYGGVEYQILTDNTFTDDYKTGELFALKLVQELNGYELLKTCVFPQKKG